MDINEIRTKLLNDDIVRQLDQSEHRPSKILVVDDDTSIRKGLTRLLQADNYDTVEAQNGREAIKAVAAERPDLILLDLMMPELNGLEVCSLLKNSEETRLIPIIMITAVHEQEEKLMAINAGVDDFINKPINLSELRARVKSLLRMKHLNDLLDRSDTVIASLANAIEAKDQYTEGHNERVSQYAAALAQAVGLSEKEQEIIRMAGILHDIGKIGVPDSILNKPGTLSEEEFALIKSHPQNGEKILNPLHSLNVVREVVLYHHERYDGTGYPSGLKGDQIPVSARIVAIADSYDAMTTKRPYREAMTKKAALNELKEMSGQMWDPDLVKIFIEMVQNGDGKDIYPAS